MAREFREVQFQTSHARRSPFALAFFVPLLPGLMWIGGEVAGDADLGWPFPLVVVGLELLGLLFWVVRRDHLGLFITETTVEIGRAVAGREVVRLQGHASRFEVASDSKMSRVRFLDGRGSAFRVSAMQLARPGYPFHKRLGSNELLVRDAPKGRGTGRWRTTGVTWRDGDPRELLAWLDEHLPPRSSR